VNAKDLARDDGSDREGVEHVDKRLPSLDVGPSFTFVVESVDCEKKGGAEEQQTENQETQPHDDPSEPRLKSHSPRVTFAHS
jgi:hypothetical protein